jgi:hypothetical protein
MFQLTENSVDYETIGMYKYSKYRNVYYYKECNFDSYEIHTKPFSGEPTSYFLILVTSFSDSFFHWIAECAIYIPFYLQLKKQYPLLKIVFKTKFQYHTKLLELFGLSDDDVVYSITDFNNISLFPLPISLLNKNSINNDYILYAEHFIKCINYVVEEDMNNKKWFDVLIMPRQKDENSPANSGSRINNCDDIINNIPTAKILNTDKIVSIKEQLYLVKSSKTIILSDGSAFLFNGLLATNSTIIVLGDIVISQAKDYKKMNFYMEFIKKNNNVIFLPYSNGNFNNCSFFYKDLPREHLVSI